MQRYPFQHIEVIKTLELKMWIAIQFWLSRLKIVVLTSITHSNQDQPDNFGEIFQPKDYLGNI